MHQRQKQVATQEPHTDESPRSNGHSHSHGATSSENLRTWIVQVGILVNLGLAVVKLFGGWAFKSKSLTADGWHSMTDLVTDVLALVSVLLTSVPSIANKMRPAVPNAEGLIALTISGLLIVMGAHEGWESLMVFKTSFFGRSSQFGDAGDLAHDIPSLQAVWIAGLTILAKEWLYHKSKKFFHKTESDAKVFTNEPIFLAMKIAIESKSSVLASNAVHQRADSLMSMVTIVAILGSNIFEDTAWIDSVGGLCISVIVIRAGFENLTSTIQTWK